MKKTAGIERRSGQDRRQKPIPFFKLLLFKGKRRTLRRAEDRKQIVVLDRYHPPLLASILIVLGLSLADAVLTLILLERGAVELNPVMRYYLDHGPMVLVIVKYGLTALAVLIMVVLGAIISTRYRIGALMITFCGFIFGTVVIWQLYLLAISRLT